MNQPNKNVLLNVLNVITRISDKHFISIYWGKGNGYQSIITSCSEAIEILDDYCFFDLTLEEKGNWKNLTCKFSDDLVSDLTLLARELDTFKKYDLKVEKLLNDEDWLMIMQIAERTKTKLSKEINAEERDDYLI